MSVSLHPYRDADLADLTRLMNHWSDDACHTAETLAPTIRTLSEKSDNELWLAKDEHGALLGYVQIGPIFLLAHEPHYEIMQILVDRTQRSRGVGAAMLAAIEKIVLARGFSIIRLSSRQERADAHRFYRKNAYTEFKSSKFFEKRMDSGNGLS